MKLQYHIAFSTVISGILFLLFRSWGLAVSCFISGIFIDLDHIIDVSRQKGVSFNVKNFFHTCDKCQFDDIILIWHGWEWIFLFAIVAWLSNWNPWATGIFIGLFQHLILDAIYNAPTWRTYSLIWRWRNNFHFDTIFPNLTPQKYKHRNGS